MIGSQKPSKQRKALYGASLHRRQKLIAAHLAKPLIKQFGRRSLPLRKGDEVKVMRGKNAGLTGKVSDVDLKGLKVYIEGAKRKKVSGQEVAVPFRASKLMITGPVMDDPHRKQSVERALKARGEKK